MSTIQLQGSLGQIVHIDITDHADSLRVMREWGAKGYSSGDVPAGGYSLPYCMADTFDWSLIGARPWTNADGEAGVMHRGSFYKRRDLAASKKGKTELPACVKFSRGARPSDPEHLKEGDEGGFQYVTLIQFRSQGKSIPDFEVPKPQAQAPATRQMPRPAAPEAQPSEPTITAERAREFRGELSDLLADTIQREVKHSEYISHYAGRPITRLSELTESDIKLVLDAARKEPKGMPQAS